MCSLRGPCASDTVWANKAQPRMCRRRTQRATVRCKPRNAKPFIWTTVLIAAANVDEIHVAAQPQAHANFVFFKFHKVGGTTVTNNMLPVLIERLGALPSMHETFRGQKLYQARLDRSTAANICLDHHSSLQALKAFQLQHVLKAPRSERVALMLESAGTMMREACPLVPGLPLYTGVMLRDPVERIISKYYFQRSYWCAQAYSKQKGIQCAANALSLEAWFETSAKAVLTEEDVLRRAELAEAKRDALQHDPNALLEKQCEPLAFLGQAANCTDVNALSRAKATLREIDVVGISDFMPASLALFERRFGLPQNALANYTSYLVNCDNKPAVSHATRKALESHPALRMDRALYKFARQRFMSDVRREGLTHLLSEESSHAERTRGRLGPMQCAQKRAFAQRQRHRLS